MLPQPYNFLTSTSVIPVMVIERETDAVPMAQALVAGGIKVLEITLRTPCALAAIKAISDAVPDAHVGAGTVCNSDDFAAAVDAGARFIVSPGQSDALFNQSIASNIPLLPGAVTATEVMRAAEAGFKVLKFFPASTSGGAAAIKAFAGPFSDISFVPTGGIGPKNLMEYLDLPNVQAAGGSWMLPKDKVQVGDWQAVTQLSREACELSNVKELTQ
ncbi:MAG: bifunctional 4-hydroxy-2-oxoglutarate aldolase/2-dehydro-3-deoxy-phosphogluconate aldolase [Luminiphilus sp.]|nr:bifunctional 4-hydroxy-2-oxoglutarate aldolase/2-dehydro-3-deoxy-phosphogluconate aldolase [Luminiphilus sp.]